MSLLPYHILFYLVLPFGFYFRLSYHNLCEENAIEIAEPKPALFLPFQQGLEKLAPGGLSVPLEIQSVPAPQLLQRGTWAH